MSDIIIIPQQPKLIGIAADHGGFELKQFLTVRLRGTGHKVVDFGDRIEMSTDDYPDFVIPLARAVASGEVQRGIAIWKRGGCHRGRGQGQWRSGLPYSGILFRSPGGGRR